MKRIVKQFFSNGTPLTADDLNDMIDAINEVHFKVAYLFYQKTDPKKAAEIMAEILGAKNTE